MKRREILNDRMIAKNDFSRKHANYIRYSLTILIQYIGNIGPKTIIEGKQL